MPDDRAKLGYESGDSKHDFVVCAYSEDDHTKVYDLLCRSHIVIFGSCPDEYIEYRMNLGKPAFLYTERFFKKGVWRRFIPQTRKKVVSRIIKYKDKPLYVLCAGGFVSWELTLCGFDGDKCFRWGYFPVVNKYEDYPKRKNQTAKLLWAGRMLDWKCTCHAIEAARLLKAQKVDFDLDIIGAGEQEQNLRELVKSAELEDRVHFLGSMPPSDVAEHMRQADIFLMTSNFYEGWGAVVNEAMSTGCAVLASSAAGCVPYLITDGDNGLIYKFGDMNDLAHKLRKLIEDKPLRETLGRKAIETIQHEYSADLAAQRFMEFVSSPDGKKPSYESGPMSKAPIIKNNWYKP